MAKAVLPIGIIMQRRRVQHIWADDAWSAVGIVENRGNLPRLQTLSANGDQEQYLVSGLQLELHQDENDGYFENWAAPAPKVFVMWQMQDGRAMPVVASVSYSEGARMLDSGESADGVAMPTEIHLWMREYLQANYKPRVKRGREHG